MDTSQNESSSKFFEVLSEDDINRLKFAIAASSDLLNEDTESKIIDEDIINPISNRLAQTYNKNKKYDAEIGNIYLGGVPYKSWFEESKKVGSIKFSIDADKFKDSVKNTYNVDLKNGKYSAGYSEGNGKKVDDNLSTNVLNDDTLEIKRIYWGSENSYILQNTLIRDIKTEENRAIVKAFVMDKKWISKARYKNSVKGSFYVLLEKDTERIYPVYISKKNFTMDDAKKIIK